MRNLRGIGVGVFLIFVGAATLPFVSSARGDYFFTLSATGAGPTETEKGGTLLHLIDDLITRQGDFGGLTGVAFTSSLTYGGIPNAILFSANAAQTTATITIPSTGFTRTFTGTSATDVQNQIRDFFEHDDSSAYSDFLKVVDQTSPLAAIDGNPQASTAFVATDAFERFGIRRTVSESTSETANGLQFQINGSAGTTAADGIDGQYIDLGIASNLRFTDHIGLTLATIGQYRDVGNSAAYTIGEIVGLPITILNRNGPGLSWDLTPWAFAALAASYDQVSGTVLVGGGGTSSLNWRLGNITFTLADQISYNGDVSVIVDQYHFDAPVDQWILKNGGQVAWNPGGGALFVDAGIAYSDFINKAAIPDYWTPSAGVGFNLGAYSSLRVGYIGDFAPHYSTSGGEATFALKL